MSIQVGVPQGFVLGPVLFTLYTQSLVIFVERHSLCFQLYADDNHLYEACKIEDLPSLVSSTYDCISDVKKYVWIVINLNSMMTKLNFYNHRNQK